MDAANPTSPVLSGSPLFNGPIMGIFVTPSGQRTTVNHFALDVGYIDNPGSVTVTAYAAYGLILKRVRVNHTGIVHVAIEAPGIATFTVAETSYEASGFAIDNVSFPTIPHFTIKGHLALPKATPSDPNSEFIEGSPKLAAECDSGQAANDRLDAEKWVHKFRLGGAFDGADFLQHFLDGSGTPINRSNNSFLADEVKVTSVFGRLNGQIQKAAKQLLDSKKPADVTDAMYPPDFPIPRHHIPSPNLATAAAFGGTQGLDITGDVYEENGFYHGTITYIIRDVYGFYPKPAFMGMGPKMHYLQGTCGAPSYPKGARWFYDSVTVTVPFNQSAAS